MSFNFTKVGLGEHVAAGLRADAKAYVERPENRVQAPVVAGLLEAAAKISETVSLDRAVVVKIAGHVGSGYGNLNATIEPLDVALEPAPAAAPEFAQEYPATEPVTNGTPVDTASASG